MRTFLAHSLDRLAFRMACRSIPDKPNTPPQLIEAQALISQPDYLDLQNVPPAEVRFDGHCKFSFPSLFHSPWAENNVVRGKYHWVSNDWRQFPTMILVHGWNGESGYDYQFPYLAWRLNRQGVNAIFFELPYHAQRKPAYPAPVRNFISHDFLRMAEAVKQSMLDATALANWLRSLGVPAVGLWGISLGAWLTGLLACYDARWDCAVLLTPVVRMDRAFEELPFCAPISRGHQGLEQTLGKFNLAAHRPRIKTSHLLLVESEFDLFAPAATVDELWQVWGQPEIWRYRHGHISILMSLPILERITRWASEKLSGPGGARPGRSVHFEPRQH